MINTIQFDHNFIVILYERNHFISVTFRDGNDGPDRCWPYNMLILAHSPAIRAVCVGSECNLLSKYAKLEINYI